MSKPATKALSGAAKGAKTTMKKKASAKEGKGGDLPPG